MTAIKIFGERNTGTNYLWWLLEQNTNAYLLPGSKPKKCGWMKSPYLFDRFYNRAFRHELGWKHGFPLLDPIRKWNTRDNLLVVTLTKNPYAFLLSLYRRPYHYQGKIPSDFSTFLRTPWRTLQRENSPEKSFVNPVEIWNKKNASYLLLEKETGVRTLNIRYEDLLKDPELIIADICKNHQNLKMNPHFRNLETSTKNTAHTHKDYQSYYLQEQWKESINPEDRAYIRQNLNKEVVINFGYSL